MYLTLFWSNFKQMKCDIQYIIQEEKLPSNQEHKNGIIKCGEEG